jgi:predicted amidophosphoribosyltransferase
MCLACGRFAAGLCSECVRGLRPAPEGAIGGLLVRSAFDHDASARALVRRLKYEGVELAAAVLAEAMAPLLPTNSEVLVPVPRSLSRRVQFGIDQSFVLAQVVSRESGVPLARLLAASPVHLANAGRRKDRRRPPRFRALAGTTAAVVLVDDVLTTGTTLRAAAGALGRGVVGAVTATRAMPWANPRPTLGRR